MPRALGPSTTTNARRVLSDIKGRAVHKPAKRPSYKGPTSSKSRQNRALRKSYR